MAKEKKKKFTYHITGWWKRLFLSRTFKDDLFRKVFQDRSAMLDLYNALNASSYSHPRELEVTTIENAVYLSMKNDLSFIIASVLNLYEHHSTFNPNMPVRGLSYFARLYESYISRNGLDIYGKTLVRLPRPQYIVFYNGRQNQPDELELKLSDAFEPETGNPEQETAAQPALECRVRVLNINPGHNEKLLQNCRRLLEYACFVETVNKNLDAGYRLEYALEQAIDDCIEKDILKDILIRSRSEVLHMLLTEYNAKKHLQHTFNEGLEQGRAEGRNMLLRFFRLNQILLKENRLDDLERASTDENFRNELFEKYQL